MKHAGLKVIAGSIAALLMGALIFGAGFEATATAFYWMKGAPGKLIDIGGYRLYLQCQGAGTPTIVFDGGLGDASDVWRDIVGSVTRQSRTCLFDRAGLGRSDIGPRPRTAVQMATELHSLLHAGGEPSPYLLVAHSMAGYNARVYASRYPSEVAGMLLLDVAHPDQNILESVSANQDRTDFMRKQKLWAELAPLGITRLLGHCKWSPQHCGRSYWTTIEEFGPFNDISPGQVRSAGDLGAMPLIVLAHDPELAIRDDPTETVHHDEQADLEMQRQLARLSSQGCMVIARGSRHYVQDDRPDLVLKSLAALLADIRLSDPHKVQTWCPESR
jgi:pimeloyl-ACP methyl ester carboxylesterase